MPAIPASNVQLPPELGALLTRLAETPDLETALRKVLADYIALKQQEHLETIARLETKWGMDFQEFSRRIEEDSLEPSAFSYEAESDYWEWEKAVTLVENYTSLRASWM